jgi:WD40 repeat protein
VLLLASSGGLYWLVWGGRDPGQDATPNPKDPPSVTKAEEPPRPDERKQAPAPGSPAGIYRRTVRFAFASDAPVIVGTGRAEPIELGAEVPYSDRGDTLHVWDWSKSRTSRVMKDIRLWPEDRFVLSPDGKLLVWAKGDVLDLATGERSTIDLGGEFHIEVGGESHLHTLPRIEHLQFAPDGRRLALLVTNLVLTKSTHPLRHQDLSTKQALQIVEFPSGKLACECPIEPPAHLPLALSADGRRVAFQSPLGKSGWKIVERSGLTGEPVREYKPHLREFATAICYSPDGNDLAVFDSAGDILLWDTKTGELKHTVPQRYHSMVHLRFSPDGKLLAFSSFRIGSPKLSLVDVATGTVVGTLPHTTSDAVHWAADGKSFDVIETGNSIAERRDGAGGLAVFNVFPSVQTFKVEDFRKK